MRTDDNTGHFAPRFAELSPWVEYTFPQKSAGIYTIFLRGKAKVACYQCVKELHIIAQKTV